MKAGFFAASVVIALALPPLAVPALAQFPIAGGPAALSVPHPLPPPVSTLPSPPRDLFQVSHGYRQLPPGHYQLPVFYQGPALGYGYTLTPGTYQPSAPTSVTPKPARGGLRFEASPATAQVFIDGLYAGVSEDFGVSALELSEGTHHVELRAAGYAPLHFDVDIAANQTKRYRGDLARLPVAEPSGHPAAPVAPAKKATYIIPHCYAGDRPPTGTLPPGCDLSALVVR